MGESKHHKFVHEAANGKPKLVLDMDDTLNVLLQVWLEMYNRDYDDNLTVHDIKTYEILNYIKPECGNNIFCISR